MAACPQLLPACAVLALVAGDVFIECVKRPVRCGIGDVHEEGVFASRSFFDHINGFVANRVSKVEVLEVAREKRVLLGERIGKEVAPAAAQDAVVAVEAALGRHREARSARVPSRAVDVVVVAPDMPLARHESTVSSRLQGLGDCDHVVAQVALVLRLSEIGNHVADSRLMRVESCEERRAGGTASG